MLITSWEKPTAHILNGSKCQNAPSAVDTELCKLVGLHGTCHCPPEQTWLLYCCDSRHFPAGSAGSDLRHTEKCPQSCPEHRPCHEHCSEWMDGGHADLERVCAVVFFTHVTHTGVICFVVNLHKTSVVWEFQPFEAEHKLCRTADGI